MGLITKGFDAGMANRPFLVFDLRALRRSTLSARVTESHTHCHNLRVHRVVASKNFVFL